MAEKKTTVTDAMKSAYGVLKDQVPDLLGGKPKIDEVQTTMEKIGRDYLDANGRGAGFVRPIANEIVQAYNKYLATGKDPIYGGADLLKSLQYMSEAMFADGPLVAEEQGMKVPDEVKKRQEAKTLEVAVKEFITTGKNPWETQ